MPIMDRFPDVCAPHFTMALSHVCMNYLHPYHVGGDVDIGRIVRYLMLTYGESLKSSWPKSMQAGHRDLV